MDKKWVIERGDVIDKRLALNPVIQRIMNARGVSSFEEAQLEIGRASCRERV